MRNSINAFRNAFHYNKSTISATTASLFGRKSDLNLANDKFNLYQKMMRDLSILLDKNCNDKDGFKKIIIETAKASYAIRCRYRFSEEKRVYTLSDEEIKKYFPHENLNQVKFEIKHGTREIYRQFDRAVKPCSFERAFEKALNELEKANSFALSQNEKILIQSYLLDLNLKMTPEAGIKCKISTDSDDDALVTTIALTSATLSFSSSF